MTHDAQPTNPDADVLAVLPDDVVGVVLLREVGDDVAISVHGQEVLDRDRFAHALAQAAFGMNPALRVSQGRIELDADVMARLKATIEDGVRSGTLPLAGAIPLTVELPNPVGAQVITCPEGGCHHEMIGDPGARIVHHKDGMHELVYAPSRLDVTGA